MDAVVSEADRQVRSAGRLDPSGCLSATAVDPLASSIDRGARRRHRARAPAPLPATCARGVAGAGSDAPFILGHLFLGHAGRLLDGRPSPAVLVSVLRAVVRCTGGRRASCPPPPPLGHVPPPPPPTRASFASCSPNDSRATQRSLEGASQLAWYVRAYSPAHAAECAGASVRASWWVGLLRPG